ncbi:MAG TPA: site-2 protease family protein [Candidatus Magasanikbacteria bacterium]|nr:site-2 protease family protein [Candidatus Magasanikbacteria bacterium]
MDSLISLFYLLVIIPSAIIHEYMHGWVADRLGDPTARYAGRLTLNPKSHVDLWGTIILPILLYLSTGGRFLFAYAKPVPYNPYNLKNQRTGPMMVALAGPASNLLLAFAFSIVLRVLPISDMTLFLSIIVYANIGLAIFNLLPIPPLDGSKVLYALLPDSMWKVKTTLERYGFMILIGFILFFPGVISPVVQYIFQLFVGDKISM